MTRYGFFESSLSAADAIAATEEYGQLEVSSEGLFWIEYRPDLNGRNILCFRNWSGQLKELTPEPFSVRSRVYEYGGKSWCLLDHQVAFINGADQQIWLQSLTGGAPIQLTDRPGCRYGEPVWDARRQRIIAIQEQPGDNPTQPEHSIVAIQLNSGTVTELVSGSDFYASPTLSPSAGKLAWISWNHPHMPWYSTSLYCGELNTQGEISTSAIVDGDQQPRAIQQPQFESESALLALSDHHGWWNLYRYLMNGHQFDESAEGKEVISTGRAEPVWPRNNDYGIPPWQLGGRSWDQTSDGQLIACIMEAGEGQLWLRTPEGDEQRLAPQYALFRQLCSYRGKVYSIATSADAGPAIIEINIDPEDKHYTEVRLLRGANRPGYSVALPEPVAFPVDGEQAFGFFYSPTDDIADQKPPLIVISHGGPTAATYPVLNPKIQYWTSRGFAVIDLNYRGSTGYGREYRNRLAASWGETDWRDAEAAVDHLINQQRVNGEHIFIRGSSAGGYTTLCALAFSDRFSAGASYYGVSDPLSLTRDTHKFESHYLNWLIGDPDSDRALYKRRSPLSKAGQINCPMIFFQGAQDKVVVPSQTELMVNALKQQQIPVEYHLYPEEQHGFRQPENQISSLEAELRFYQSVLK